MKKDSIFFTITITFIVSILLIIVSFTILYKGSEKRETHFLNKRSIDISQIVLRECAHNGISKELKENLAEMNFSIITDPKEQNSILRNKNLIVKWVKHKRRAVIQYLILDGKHLIYIHTPLNRIILRDDSQIINHQNTILAIFLVILFAFIFLYITTLKKLKPLKTLKNQVKDFGDEEFDIDCANSNKDEISQLANEFDKSAKKLKKIKESRNIFIRNIMHELKTPITKGKFLAKLPQTQDNQDKMQRVFYRLEALNNEFASIEELISTKRVLDKKEYYLADIIDNAVDILMCDEDEVIKDFENIKVSIDFKLFSIAIKNLLDNGIKYSTNKKVKIKTQGAKIIFENLGEKLIYPLNNYFEPFFKGDDIKLNQSFGLGLYILKHILDANNYDIEYKYEDGINKFILLKIGEQKVLL